MKGLVSVMVLERIEELLKFYTKDRNAAIADYFDLVGGTSTGSIIAALLLCPDKEGRPRYAAKDILELYTKHGKEIFTKKKLYPINTVFGLFGSRYSNKKFAKLLDMYLGELTIKELLKESLYTSYDTYSRQAVFFSTVSQRRKQFENYKVKDVVLASTAAPTFFPPMHIGEKSGQRNCYIDGGIVANNPALCLMVESLKIPQHENICDTWMLSVGSVSSPTFYSYKEAKRWGFLGWSLPLLNILMDGSEETAQYEVDKIFKACHAGDKYLRVDLKTERPIPDMDCADCKSVMELISFGQELIREREPDLELFVRRLVKNSG